MRSRTLVVGVGACAGALFVLALLLRKEEGRDRKRPSSRRIEGQDHQPPTENQRKLLESLQPDKVRAYRDRERRAKEAFLRRLFTKQLDNLSVRLKLTASQRTEANRLFQTEIQWYLENMYPKELDRPDDDFEQRLLWSQGAEEREKEIGPGFLALLSQPQRLKYARWKRKNHIRWFILKGKGRYDLAPDPK